MSIDTCHLCGDYVDTDFDVDCYDNQGEKCRCERCREALEEAEEKRASLTPMQFIEFMKKRCEEVRSMPRQPILTEEHGRTAAYGEMSKLIESFLERV